VEPTGSEVPPGEIDSDEAYRYHPSTQARTVCKFAAPGTTTFLAEGDGLECRDVFSVRIDRLTADLSVIVGLGEIDSITAPRLSTSLHRELERKLAVLVLDLTGVSFLGVAGLQVLESALARAQTLSTTLKLVHHDYSAVQSALRTGVMTGLFPTLRTVTLTCAPSASVTTAGREPSAPGTVSDLAAAENHQFIPG
jgi:anti-anti-sigma factor